MIQRQLVLHQMRCPEMVSVDLVRLQQQRQRLNRQFHLTIVVVAAVVDDAVDAAEVLACMAMCIGAMTMANIAVLLSFYYCYALDCRRFRNY